MGLRQTFPETKESSEGHTKGGGKRGTKEGRRRDETRANKGRKRGETRANPLRLSDAQSQIYLWLQYKGKEGQFSMAEICESLSIAYITVRRASNHLKKTGILDYENDRIQQDNHYRLNTEIPVKFARRSGKGAQHERNMSAKRAKGERKTSEASYNSNSSSLNKKPILR